MLNIRKQVRGFYDVLGDLWAILTSWLTWIPTLCACGVVAFWLILAFAHSIPNPYRSILLWGLFFGLTAGAAVLNPEGRAG